LNGFKQFEEAMMAKTTRRAIWVLTAVLALAAPPALHAQSAPAASPTVDPQFESQKAAFDALPEADRRAIQDALIWSGQYVGVVDGVFGKRTRDSILAYQASVKAPADGVINAAQLAAMTGAAQKARAAVRFQLLTDEKTGVKIGAPLKILEKRTANDAGGSRLMKADGSIVLDLSSVAGGDAKLAMLFAALTAEAPGRKITLKINRPDFFVVSGEEGGRKIYERMAKAPANSSDPNLLRGFRFAYPVGQAGDLDRIGVAIADSFEPFPAPGSAPAAGPAATAGATPVAVPTPPSAPGRPFLAATGFLVGPGQVLSAIGADDCSNPTIEGKPAKFLREDRQLGLSLLQGELGAGATAAAPSFGALGPDLVALSYGADEPGGRVVLNVAAASPLALNPSETHPSLLAPLAKSAGGSPVFDRNGGLVAIIAQSIGDPKLVAGVAPLAPHKAIGVADIQRFLSLTSEAPSKAGEDAPRGAGQIAAAERPYVVAISCRR
jgi:peptidoglycan hydrolase-like protein with peptidoglycan-binding domain